MVLSNSANVSTHDLEDIECHLFSLKLESDGTLDISGFAYVSKEKWRSRVVGVRLIRAGLMSREYSVQNLVDPRVNVHSNVQSQDRSTAAFRCCLDLRDLVVNQETETFDLGWNLEVVLESEFRGIRATDHVPVRSWQRGGAVQFNRAEYLSPDTMLQAKWDDGVIVNVARKAVMAESYFVSGSVVHMNLTLRNFAGTHLGLRVGERIVGEVELVATGDRTFTGSIDVDGLDASSAENAYFVVINAKRSTRFVHYAPNPGTVLERVATSDDLYVCRSARSLLRLDRKNMPLMVGSISLCGVDLIEVRGWTEPANANLRLRLASSVAATVVAPISVGGAGEFKAYIRLREAGHSNGGWRALRRGSYRIEALNCDDAVVAEAVAGQMLYRTIGSTAQLPAYRLSVSVGRAERVAIKIDSPLSDYEKSKFGRVSIRRAAHRVRTVKHTALFEAFNGRSGGDNPRPIGEHLVERVPNFDIRWAVADYSVEVPSFAKPVIIHSEEYYRLVNSSELLITNNWLPAETRQRDTQTILQTWHGTPLKTLGLDRFHSGSARQRANMEKMTALWDGMISQNPYSTERFRSCYAFAGKMLETGYPRNDVLVNGLSEGELLQLRQRLGVGADQKVLLYMPTWRENQTGIFAGLQVDRLQSVLGSDWSVLVRGHSMTTKGEGTKLPSGVKDVSLFADASLLYLVADVLVTDYSSAMFDFSVTGKPIVYFTPDMDSYRDELRGMYFDLRSEAPGPIVSDLESLIDSIQRLGAVEREYEERYSAWQAKFNPWDDGKSTERVVKFLLDPE